MPNSSVVVQGQLANHGAESHLRRFDIHLVENLGDLYNYFPIAKDDDRVGPLIGDNFCVADRDCFRRGIDRFRRKFLRDVQVAAARWNRCCCSWSWNSRKPGYSFAVAVAVACCCCPPPCAAFWSP